MSAVADRHRRPRVALLAAAAAALLSAGCDVSAFIAPPVASGGGNPTNLHPSTATGTPDAVDAAQVLEQLPVKGRASKTGYDRAQFGAGWAEVDGCDVRDWVLARQLTNVRFDAGDGGRCTVLEGDLADPDVGRNIHFVRGGSYATSVDLDHVVALGDAWQTGAQQLTAQQRAQFANDPRNLQAVDPSANRQKGDSDAASWLPANKAFRCSYVGRQVQVKAAYALWVTAPEKDAMRRVLKGCAPGVGAQVSR